MAQPEDALLALAPDVWCVNSHFVKWGCRGSIRMTILRAASGLLLYSPVALSDAVLAGIRALGPVRWIMAPNLFHHFYLRPAMAAFPQAEVLVPEGLKAKVGGLDHAVELVDTAAPQWPESVAHATFRAHRLKETVLFHAPSGTLVTADLLYNYHEEHYPAERRFFRAIGCYGGPRVAFYHRLAVTDRAAARTFVADVARWPIRRIIMSHGRILEGADCGAAFEQAWRALI